MYYGKQPWSEVMAMSDWELQLACDAVGLIIDDENAAVKGG